MKLCNICKLEKPLSEFYKHKKSNDGYNWECKECAKARTRLWRENNLERKRLNDRLYHSKNKERLNEYNRKWRLDNPEYCKEYYRKNIEYFKNWTKNNKLQIRNNRLKCYHRNPAKYISTVRRYQRSPLGVLTNARQHHKRRNFELNSECTLTLKQWDKILETQNNRCNICGKIFCKSRPPTQDHIIPLSKGGGLTFENVQALCGPCNSSKSNKLDYSNIVSWGIFNS